MDGIRLSDSIHAPPVTVMHPISKINDAALMKAFLLYYLEIMQ